MREGWARGANVPRAPNGPSRAAFAHSYAACSAPRLSVAWSWLYPPLHGDGDGVNDDDEGAGGWGSDAAAYSDGIDGGERDYESALGAEVLLWRLFLTAMMLASFPSLRVCMRQVYATLLLVWMPCGFGSIPVVSGADRLYPIRFWHMRAQVRLHPRMCAAV